VDHVAQPFGNQPAPQPTSSRPQLAIGVSPLFLATREITLSQRTPPRARFRRHAAKSSPRKLHLPVPDARNPPSDDGEPHWSDTRRNAKPKSAHAVPCPVPKRAFRKLPMVSASTPRPLMLASRSSTTFIAAQPTNAWCQLGNPLPYSVFNTNKLPCPDCYRTQQTVKHSKLHPITNPLTVRIRGFGGLLRRRLISQPPRVASEPSALSIALFAHRPRLTSQSKSLSGDRRLCCTGTRGPPKQTAQPQCVGGDHHPLAVTFPCMTTIR
jgi:hypothetical protein